MVSLRWLGHSTFEVSGSKTVLFDPFLDQNPKSPIKASDITDLDAVLVSHSHFDHMADAYGLCARTGAVLVSQYEITEKGQQGGVENVQPMNIGGSVSFDGLTVHMVNAHHTVEWGDATGLILEIDGKTIYHVGDTCLFSDLKLVRKFFDVDVMLCPIGDRFTMGPRSAAQAVEWVGPRQVIPIHYGTWPAIPGDPHDFKRFVDSRAEVVILEPGQSHTL